MSKIQGQSKKERSQTKVKIEEKRCKEEEINKLELKNKIRTADYYIAILLFTVLLYAL